VHVSYLKSDPRDPAHGDHYGSADTAACDDRYFRVLVENCRDVIATVSSGGEILYVSPNVVTVLGHTPDQLIGRDLFAGIHPDDLAGVRAEFAQESGRASCRYQHRDGSWRWFETSSGSYVTPEGVSRRVLVARDVTEERQTEADRRRLESELARAEKFAVLGTLAGGMAHDLNNILTTVAIHASLAQMTALSAEVSESLGQIVKAVGHAKNITRSVLEFTRQRTSDRVALQLEVVVEEALDLLRPTLPANTEIRAEFGPNVAAIIGNRTQLHQVVVNLWQNSVHALQGKPGTIVTRVDNAAVDATLARQYPVLRTRPHVVLSVIDTGHGMDATTLRRIFEPCFSTKSGDGHSGLGLAVVERIAREHAALIHVDSEPGRGTCFQLYLPAAEAAPDTTGGSPA